MYNLIKNDKSGVAEAFPSTQNTWTSTLGLEKPSLEIKSSAKPFRLNSSRISNSRPFEIGHLFAQYEI